MTNIVQTAGTVADGSSAVLGLVVVMVVCFTFIGMPLGCLLGTWWAIRSRRDDFGDKACPTTIDQVAELVKHSPPLRVYLAAKLCLGYRLLFLKGKLLLQQLLLESKLAVKKTLLITGSQSNCKPHAKQCGTESSEQNLVGHKNVTRPNEKSSPTATENSAVTPNNPKI